MAFQTKSFLSITASMINRVRSTCAKISDFTIGSIARTLLEAVAQEIDELYQQMVIGLNEAIPVATYLSFSFPALQLTAATNLIRLTFSPGVGVLVPAGTVFTAAGGSVTYVSQVDTTMAAGATVLDVLVAATMPGIVGNLAVNTSFTLSPQPATMLTATNLSAFVNGTDAETSDQRLARFNQYIAALARGTAAAIQYGATTATVLDSAGNVIERVKYATVVEPYETDNTQPIGLVDVYIHNGVGGTSSALVAQANQVVYGYYDASGNAVPGYKAAGAHVVLTAATEAAVNVVATLTPAATYDHATLVGIVSSILFTYIQSVPPGGSCLVSTLYQIAMNVAGVADFVMTTPIVDVVSDSTHKLMPGTIAIS